MLEIVTTKKFEKNLKLMKKRGKDLTKLKLVLNLLIKEETLAPKYYDHSLVGNWIGYRECHIESDWLLVYKMEKTELLLVQTGSHSDLF